METVSACGVEGGQGTQQVLLMDPAHSVTLISSGTPWPSHTACGLTL